MISQVTISVNHGDSRDVWFLFETGHKDLFEFHEDLAADGTVYGTRIDSEPAGQGRRREVRRYECIVAKGALVSVIPMQCSLITPAAASA